MRRRADNLQSHCLIRTLEDAQAAAHAVLIDYKGLHLLASGDFLHFNGFEMASFHAGLASAAFLLVNYGPVAAGGDQFPDIGQLLKT